MVYGPPTFPRMWGLTGFHRPRCRLRLLETKMAVPKRKVTRAKRGMRRSSDALKNPTYVEDKSSGELRRPHHVDLKTGMYRGRQVLAPKED